MQLKSVLCRSLVVNEDISVSSLASLQVNDGLVGIAHWSLLDETTDLLVGDKLEHIPQILRRADGRSINSELVVDDKTSGDLVVTIIRQSDGGEATSLLQQHHVLVKGDLIVPVSITCFLNK